MENLFDGPTRLIGDASEQTLAPSSSSFEVTYAPLDTTSWSDSIMIPGRSEFSLAYPGPAENTWTTPMEPRHALYPEFVGASSHTQSPYKRGSSMTPAASDHSYEERPYPNRSTRRQANKAAMSTTKTRLKAKERKNPIELTAPISELTKDSKIELYDVEAYVARGTEERKREVVTNKGIIKRPMNSYIMYRRTYQERIQAFANQRNHQEISRLASASWALEPQEVKDYFAELAKIEKANLMLAFPEYKYDPKTKKGQKRKGNEIDEDSSDEPSNIGDIDPDWAPQGTKSNKRQARRAQSVVSSNHGDQDSLVQRDRGSGYQGQYQFTGYSTELGSDGQRQAPIGQDDDHDGFYGQQYLIDSSMTESIGNTTWQSLRLLQPVFDGEHQISGIPGMSDSLLNVNLPSQGVERTNFQSNLFLTDHDHIGIGAFSSAQFRQAELEDGVTEVRSHTSESMRENAEQEGNGYSNTYGAGFPDTA